MKKLLLFIYVLISSVSLAQVGIGTNNPTSTLDVNGDTRIRTIETQSGNPSFVLVTDIDGVIQKSPSSIFGVNGGSTDATRFIGGTISVTLFSTTNGALTNEKLINNGSGSYTMGTASYSSSRGGLVAVRGNGFRISNPSNGVFDIKFDTPFNEIYGVSSNIVDMYASGSTVPVTTRPGVRLLTNDNTQISYIDNYGFRVKTGGSNGSSSNRSFTFLVTGQ